MSNSIQVTYKCIDGAHFFVSMDKDAAGLCVAHTNLEVAYSEVAHQLKALFKFNHGKECNFKPSVTFETFKKAIEGSQSAAREADHSGMITAAMIQPWMADHFGKQ